MSSEASDHACPHLREQRRVVSEPAFAPAAAVCPAGAQRPSSEPLRAVSPGGGTGGWWAFCSQATVAEARV